MPRIKINIDSKKGEILRRLQNGEKQKDVLKWLHSAGFPMHLKTFQAKLRSWGASTVQTQLRKALTEPSLINAIHQLWRDKSLSDNLIATLLTAQGTPITARQVKKLRYKHNFRKYHVSEEAQEEAWQRALHAC